MGVRWYRQLYIGERAEKKWKRIVRNVQKGRIAEGAYVIAFPSNPSNLFDLYPVRILLQPYFRKTEIDVVGIGADRADAEALLVRMINEMYEKKKRIDRESCFSDGFVTEPDLIIR